MTTENEVSIPISNPEDPITTEEAPPPPPESTAAVVEPEISSAPISTRPGRKKREPTNGDQSDTQPLFEQPIILEGKRSRKPTSRLELSDLEAPKKELVIPQGRGKALGNIAYIDYQLAQASNENLGCLSQICFGQRLNKTNVRDRLKEFHGFDFERTSEDYQGHLANLNKLKINQLKSMSDILGLSTAVSQTELAENILNFLSEPIDDGKPIPQEKTTTRPAKSPRVNSKAVINYADEFDEDFENGDDELFDASYEKDDTDEDYMGSDDERPVKKKPKYTYDDDDDENDDDPDDFVYRPGRKASKKKSLNKRVKTRVVSSRSKRAPSTRTTRASAKSTPVVVENEQIATTATTTTDETKIDEDVNPAPLEQNPIPSTDVN